MSSAKIINESGGPSLEQRVTAKVSVAYDADIDQVRRVLHEVASSVDNVQPTPYPQVNFMEFGNSGLAFELRVWIARPGCWQAILGRLCGNCVGRASTRRRQNGIWGGTNGGM